LFEGFRVTEMRIFLVDDVELTLERFDCLFGSLEMGSIAGIANADTSFKTKISVIGQEAYEEIRPVLGRD
jgi:hypothetical protein